MSSDLPPAERFQQMYEEKPPWDIDKPQTAFVEAADPNGNLEAVKGTAICGSCGKRLAAR